MTHFSVLVVLPKDTTNIEKAVDSALAPFCESGSSSFKGKYLKAIDVLEDCLRTVETTKNSYVTTLEGETVSAYDERFYREPTFAEKLEMGEKWSGELRSGLPFYGKKVREYPLGTSEIKELTYSQIENGLSEMMESYYNMALIGEDEPIVLSRETRGVYSVNSNGKLVRAFEFNNPNGQWDWFKIGGRWENYFASTSGELKNAIRKKDLSIEKTLRQRALERLIYFREDMVRVNNLRTENGLPRFKNDEEWLPIWRANAVVYEEVQEKRRSRQAEKLDAYGHEWVQSFDKNHPYRVFRDSFLAGATQSYNGHILEQQVDPLGWLNRTSEEDFGSFAILKDGVWEEKGWDHENENLEAEWDSKWKSIYDQIDPDSWLVIVDCHT